MDAVAFHHDGIVGCRHIAYSNHIIEDGLIAGIFRNHDGTHPVGVTVAPASESVVGKRLGRYSHFGAIAIFSASRHAAHGGVVGRDGYRESVGLKHCRVVGIAYHRDGTGILCVSVTPPDEVVVRSWRGRQHYLLASIIGAGASGSPHGGIVTAYRDAVSSIFLKLCHESAVACHRNQTGIGGVAVVPLHKMVVLAGRGCQGHLGEVIVAAAACHGTHRCVVADKGEVVGVHGKVGRQGGVLRQGHGAGILGVAVLPL